MTTMRDRLRAVFLGGVTLLLGVVPALSQVGPAEISDARLKSLEQTHLSQLVDLNRAISGLAFPFSFRLSRYAALDPDQQIGADARGLEFVNFHDRLVLKVTGNYNAAYNADLLTPNQRANRVFDEVIVPVIGLLRGSFVGRPGFDAVGFEIAYHTRRQSKGYAYEGKEILVVVMDQADLISYSDTAEAMNRQGILNRSEIYLDGKPFGMALGERDPFDPAGLLRTARSSQAATLEEKSAQPGDQARQQPQFQTVALQKPVFQPPVVRIPSAESVMDNPRPAVPADLEALQGKYQAQLDDLAKQGAARFHFVDYAFPSFVRLGKQTALQVTLRNPGSFDKDSTSIYKRAAQSFDLFFAPDLKAMLALIPDGAEFDVLDLTILNELVSKTGKSSEALEFVFPLKVLRQFAAAETTNQDLINQSVVLVNGVRIALNLQQVE